jgi:tetratricopeptide (TPR) repeat protein
MNRPLVLWSALALAGASACAARPQTPTTPQKAIEMEGLRIVAHHGSGGQYEFEAYDAPELFERGNKELDAGRCPEAVAHYDRIAAEFADSKYVSPALYNAGLCLAQTGQPEPALVRFDRLLSAFPGTRDAEHAAFQAGHLLVDLQRFPEAITRADDLLTKELEPAARMEALAMRALALLGAGRDDEAEQQGKQALTYYRTRAEQLAADPYFAAASNYVLAEVLRRRGEAITIPDATREEQRAVLERRAQFLLDAMREYASTIQHTTSIRQTNPKWAAASGYQIGAMYDRLWRDIMATPIPSSLSQGAREFYPQELAKLVKPLLRHAIRYWELTLMMAERTGAQGEWVDKTRADLARVRDLLLDQPAGAGGMPTPEKPQSPPDPAHNAGGVPVPAPPSAAPPTQPTRGG